VATSFDDVLLDVSYSNDASGGPGWVTAIIGSGEGGAIKHRAITAEDMRSQYKIDFSEVERDRRVGLYSFSVLRQGMARAFRFLAPDNNTLEGEPVARYNSTTGELEVVTSTNGTDTEYYFVQHYQDIANEYLKRICCPSPLDPCFLIIAPVASPDDVQQVTLTPVSGVSGLPLYGEGLYGEEIGSQSAITLNFKTGKLTCAPALPGGLFIRVFCVHHWPVCFTEDLHEQMIDDATFSKIKIGLEEQLPIELGILI
jgi:hypothetical protein